MPRRNLPHPEESKYLDLILQTMFWLIVLLITVVFAYPRDQNLWKVGRFLIMVSVWTVFTQWLSVIIVKLYLGMKVNLESQRLLPASPPVPEESPVVSDALIVPVDYTSVEI